MKKKIELKQPVALFLKTIIVLLLFSAPVLVHAQAANTDAIDVAYNACLARDTSCANVGTCAFTAYDKWTGEMNNAYKRLQKSLKKDSDKAALKQSQAAWVSYSNAENKTYDLLYNKPGSQWCRLRHNSRIMLVRTRATQLRNYYEALHAR